MSEVFGRQDRACTAAAGNAEKAPDGTRDRQHSVSCNAEVQKDETKKGQTERVVTMALYKECGHYEGLCPCLTCTDRFQGRCEGCMATDYRLGAVDTDKLCLAAKQYCESGRDDVPWA